MIGALIGGGVIIGTALALFSGGKKKPRKKTTAKQPSTAVAPAVVVDEPEAETMAAAAEQAQAAGADPAVVVQTGDVVEAIDSSEMDPVAETFPTEEADDGTEQAVIQAAEAEDEGPDEDDDDAAAALAEEELAEQVELQTEIAEEPVEEAAQTTAPNVPGEVYPTEEADDATEVFAAAEVADEDDEDDDDAAAALAEEELAEQVELQAEIAEEPADESWRPPVPEIHVVELAENPSYVAEKYTGNPHNWIELQRANPRFDLTKQFWVGMRLKTPARWRK